MSRHLADGISSSDESFEVIASSDTRKEDNQSPNEWTIAEIVSPDRNVDLANEDSDPESSISIVEVQEPPSEETQPVEGQYIRERHDSTKKIKEIKVPVPEAIECDPTFIALPKKHIVDQVMQKFDKTSPKSIQDTATRLCKKLAEQRVFGPRLMTLSDYNDLPTEGIIYIHRVCRTVLQDKLKSDNDFWDIIRQAMRKLESKCRRLRDHAKRAKRINEMGVKPEDASNPLAGLLSQGQTQLLELFETNKVLTFTVPAKEKDKSTADFDLLQFQMQQALDQGTVMEDNYPEKGNEEKEFRKSSKRQVQQGDARAFAAFLQGMFEDDPSETTMSSKKKNFPSKDMKLTTGINYDLSRPDALCFAPPAMPSLTMDRPCALGGDSYMDENFGDCGNFTSQPVFRFSSFNETSWQKLYGDDQKPLNLNMHIVADKGFNFSQKDQCFVNQKKNHFQLSVNIEACDDYAPTYVAVDGDLKPIQKILLAFSGVKSEMHSTFIEIRQSQNDRKPGVHKPVQLKEIPPRQVTKVTVPRLHFSETTLYNQRKNNNPHPDQKYFLLLVRLIAVTVDGLEHLVMAYASDRVIVRATDWRQTGVYNTASESLAAPNNEEREEQNAGGDENETKVKAKQEISTAAFDLLQYQMQQRLDKRTDTAAIKTEMGGSVMPELHLLEEQDVQGAILESLKEQRPSAPTKNTTKSWDPWTDSWPGSHAERELKQDPFERLELQVRQAAAHRAFQKTQNKQRPSNPTMEMVKHIQKRMATSTTNPRLFEDLVVPPNNEQLEKNRETQQREDDGKQLLEREERNERFLAEYKQLAHLHDQAQTANHEESEVSQPIPASNQPGQIEKNTEGDPKDTTIATLVGMLNRMDLNRLGEMESVKGLLDSTTRANEMLHDLVRAANEDVEKRDTEIARLNRAKDVYKKLNEKLLKMLDDVRSEKDLEIARLNSELEAVGLSSHVRDCEMNELRDQLAEKNCDIMILEGILKVNEKEWSNKFSTTETLLLQQIDEKDAEIERLTELYYSEKEEKEVHVAQIDATKKIINEDIEEIISIKDDKIMQLKETNEQLTKKYESVMNMPVTGVCACTPRSPVREVILQAENGSFGMRLVGSSINKVKRGSDAHRKGIQKGDRIVAISGTDVENLSGAEIVKLLRGDDKETESGLTQAVTAPIKVTFSIRYGLDASHLAVNI